MPATYDPIANINITSNTANIDFTSIPSGFTDLRLQMNYYTTTNGGNGLRIRFNNDTSVAYNTQTTGGYGTTFAQRANASSVQIGILGLQAISPRSNAFGMDLFSYTNTGINKSGIVFAGGGTGGGGAVEFSTFTWQNSGAVNRITIFSADGYDFTSGTVATLYGIKAA